MGKDKVKNRINIVTGIIASVMIISMGLISLTACDKPIKSRPIVLEVVNPHTGEILKRDEKIDLPPEGTRVEIKIKDKETNVYLTDDDFPDNTIEETYSVAFEAIDEDGDLHPRHTKNDDWPTEVDPVWNYYRIMISFDCRPKSSRDPKYQRKYTTTTSYLRIYFNRPERIN